MFLSEKKDKEQKPDAKTILGTPKTYQIPKKPEKNFTKSNQIGVEKKNSTKKDTRLFGSKVYIDRHKHNGVFVVRGKKEDALCTQAHGNGQSIYGENIIPILKNETILYFRVWNPFRSKLAAAILGGVDDLFIKPGIKILYLGAANGTTVSHISDMIGSAGLIYAVEFSDRSGRDLISVSEERRNIVPIIEDARYPQKYRFLINDMVDLIFSDLAQPDQARIIAINAKYFLKAEGHFIITLKASCIDSTLDPAIIFSREVQKLKKERLHPKEQLTLEPYQRDHAMIFGKYKPQKYSGK